MVNYLNRNYVNCRIFLHHIIIITIIILDTNYGNSSIKLST